MLVDLSVETTAPYKRADREWFERHPRRSFRLRALFAGEPNIDPKATHVLVKQVAPRVREKEFFSGSLGRHAVENLPDDDLFCSAFWHALENSEGPIAFDHVIAMAKLMASGSSETNQ